MLSFNDSEFDDITWKVSSVSSFIKLMLITYTANIPSINYRYYFSSLKLIVETILGVLIIVLINIY